MVNKIIYYFKKGINYLVHITNKEWIKSLYDYSNFLYVFFIIITYTGVIYINPIYIHDINRFILYFVCAVLLIRFNPYVTRSHIANHYEFNRKIAFSAGIIIFTTTVAKQITEYIGISAPMQNIFTNVID